MTVEDTQASDLDLFEAEASGQPATSSKTAPRDKYEGKTVEDLIKMHQNAEQLIGRQSQEVSTLRRQADAILDLKKPTTEVKKEEPRQPVTVEALLNDPEKALRGAVDSSDIARRAAAAEERVARLETSITQEKFVTKHVNFAEDLQDPSFKEWVAKNPVRANLGHAASQSNFEAATHLWDMWEEHKQLADSVKGHQGNKDKIVPKGPKVPSTIKAAPSENVDTSPKYSRVKLMELREKVQRGDPNALERWKDPEFQRRMIEAYQEGRVR